MIRYILRRIIIIPPALLLANFISFAYAHFALPIHLAQNPFAFADSTAEPLIPAYINYLNLAANLNLGRIPGTVVELVPALIEASKASIGLLGITMLTGIILGVTFGIRAAKNNPPRVSKWLTFSSTLGLAMPSYYLGMIFIVGSIIYTIREGNNTPPPLPLQGFGWDKHMVMPILVLAARPIMEIAQVTANLLVAEFGKQYIVTARSFGNTWRTIRVRHALFNISAPVIIAINRSFRLLIGELILVEFLFAWPGLGRYLALSLAPSRFTSGTSSSFLFPPLVASVITLLAIFFMALDFFSAISMQYLDPRLRNAEEEALNG